MKTLYLILLLAASAAHALTINIAMDSNSIDGNLHGSIDISGGLSGGSGYFSGSNASLSLSALSEYTSPTVGKELYLYGCIAFQGIQLIGGGPGGSFLLGTANESYSSNSGLMSGISSSWYVPMIWDGDSFSGSGTWSIISLNAPRLAARVPDIGSTALLLLGALAVIALARHSPAKLFA